MIQFTALTDTNTAVLTLNDPRPNNQHSRKVCTLADNRSIANAILQYARERKLPVRMIEYHIQWPDQSVTQGWKPYEVQT